MDQLLITHPNSLFLICGGFNCHHANWLGAVNNLTSHGTSAKDFSESFCLTQSVNFPTHISPNGKSSLLDLVITNFHANVSYSSSAPIVSSDHVLVMVNISLTFFRKQPQQVWQFTQANWQGLQAATTLQDWSHVSTTPDIYSAWKFFYRNLLSLMHRFIPSRLQ